MRIIRPNAGFIIPEKRFVDVGAPAGKVQAVGKYRLTVRNRWGEARRGTDWFPNIILDSGLNRWGSGAIISGAAIGTGTSTPIASQTSLDTESTWTTSAGTGNNTVTAAGASPYNNSRTVVYRTALGALSGNYSEVGVGWASGSMFSRALILDGGGSPTTIAVASDEQLDIEYQLQVYPPLTDTGPSVVTISGVNYTITGRALNVNGSSDIISAAWGVKTSAAITLSSSGSVLWNGALGSITSLNPGGSGSSTGSATTDAYASLSMTRTGSVSFSLTQGNVSGGAQVAVAAWSGFAAFQYGFSPVIPKDSTKTLVLNHSVTWARRP